MEFVQNQNEISRDDQWYERKVAIDGDDCLGEERLDMTPAQRYIERWKFLKSFGFPVVDEMEVTGKNTVRMTNLTADGSEFFKKRKAAHLVVEVLKGVKRELTENEKRFLLIDPEMVLDDVDVIWKNAWELGFKLADDDPFDLLIHPNGRWEIILLDLERLHTVHKGDKFNLKEEHEFDKQVLEAMELNLERIKK